MLTRPETAIDDPLRLLADELAAQRSGDAAGMSGIDDEIDERMAYLEEAMAGARQARRFLTSPRAA